MAPKPPDLKRKRGRPPGASKSTEDASSREQPDTNEHEAEDELRPKKRGRKALRDKIATVTSPETLDEPARTGRRARPAQRKAQPTETPVDEKAGTKRKTESQPMSDKAKAKAKESEAPVDGDPPSSEPRRSGRGRHVLNPDELDSAKQPNLSPTQFTSPPSDSSRMPPPPRRSKKAKPEPEAPGSTPRRGQRERRAWDAEKLFSASRPAVAHGEGVTSILDNNKTREREKAQNAQVAATKSRKQKTTAQDSTAGQADAPGEGVGVVMPKTRKQKPTVQESVAGKKRPPRAPRKESPGEGPTRSKKQKDAEAIEEVILAAETIQPKRRGRKRADERASQEPEADEPSESRGHRSRKPRAKPVEDRVQEPDEPPKSGGSRRPKAKASNVEEQPDSAPAKTKRKPPQPREPEPEAEQEADAASDEEDEEMPFRYLKETIRNIPRSTITDKWTPLDPPVIQAVSAFFANVQRPVLLRLQNTNQQRGYASAALGAISRRLQSRLGRGYPFPAPTSTTTRAHAGGHEDDFNFERTVDAKQALENTLNPLLHSVSLLEREIVKEEGALARDYDLLHTLEANAKSAAQEWRDKAKREHVLAPGIKKKGERERASRDCLELVPVVEDGTLGGLFKDLEDEGLIALSQQIGSHMRSMKDNLQQIEGVVPAITQSKAALQQVLLKHLDDERYENVLLG